MDYNVPFIRILMNQPVLTWFMLYSRYLKVAERSMFFRPLTPQKSIIGRPLVQGFFRQISNHHCYYIHKILVWSQAEHRHEFRFKVWNTTNLHKIFRTLFLCFSVSLWWNIVKQIFRWLQRAENQVVWFWEKSSAMLHLLAKPQAISDAISESWSMFFFWNKSHVFFEKKHF